MISCKIARQKFMAHGLATGTVRSQLPGVCENFTPINNDEVPPNCSRCVYSERIEYIPKHMQVVATYGSKFNNYRKLKRVKG